MNRVDLGCSLEVYATLKYYRCNSVTSDIRYVLIYEQSSYFINKNIVVRRFGVT